MNDNIEVNQRAGSGSEITQIGTQIVYQGLTPSEACNLATNMFMENFPKLRDQAMEIVESRVEELMMNVTKKIEEKKIENIMAFAEPDVQYAIYKAQKSYARFGTQEMLSVLSSLIANRIEYNNDNICLKVAIDKAIEIAGLLTTKHLDFISLLFLVSQVKFGGINNIEQLKDRLTILDSYFPNVDKTALPHLNLLGCLKISLLDVPMRLADAYNLPEDQIKYICSENILKLSEGYITSPIGTILAITHLETVTTLRFNPEDWLHS